MCPLMPRVTTRTYNAHTRQIQLTHRWVHSCREGQVHIMQTQGRYSHLTDGFTNAESDNKNITHTRGRYSQLTDGPTHAESDDKSIQSKCEPDTSNSQMGQLMPRVTKRTRHAHKRQIHPTHRWVQSCREGQQVHIMQTQGRYSQLIYGFTHAESDNKNI